MVDCPLGKLNFRQLNYAFINILIIVEVSINDISVKILILVILIFIVPRARAESVIMEALCPHDTHHQWWCNHCNVFQCTLAHDRAEPHCSLQQEYFLYTSQYQCILRALQ